MNSSLSHLVPTQIKVGFFYQIQRLEKKQIKKRKRKMIVAIGSAASWTLSAPC